ncbi:MAG: zincin-like metallopeptidase domain-containing protein [Cyanobacteriota bacterium]|jgi:antirestriction protein ArdC
MVGLKVPVTAAAAVEDRLVSSLLALMESGTAPWRRDWDSQQGGHHVNLFSGRCYRGANPILLTIGLHQRGATLPYWCGAVEAKTHGLWPKQGSKAVIVLRPQVKRRGSAPENQGAQVPLPPGREEERRGEERQERCWVHYQPVPLFNVEDLEGEPRQDLIRARQDAEQPFRRTEPERLALADAVLRTWPVPMSHGGARAFYDPRDDRIQLPHRLAFHSGAALYATWAHEALHSTGHGSRLARDLAGELGSEAYAREELVAELGAVLLGERLEIGSDVSNHAAYLAEWIQLLRQSPKLLYKLLSEARQAADLIYPAQPPAETGLDQAQGGT